MHGDGLRVVDEETKGLIVDQTIEKVEETRCLIIVLVYNSRPVLQVSFCAPDRNYERGFSYICRDGTTRRWMCHGFMAVRESVSGSPIWGKLCKVSNLFLNGGRGKLCIQSPFGKAPEFGGNLILPSRARGKSAHT